LINYEVRGYLNINKLVSEAKREYSQMFSNALQQYINFKSDIKGKINYFKQFQVKNVLIIL